MPTHPQLRLTIIVAATSPFIFIARIDAEQPRPNATQPVKQVAFDRPASATVTPQSVHFGRQPSRIGDQTEQTMALEMRLTLNMRRENELLGKHQATFRTNQKRIITTTAVDADRTTAVRVQYPVATTQSIGKEGASDSGTANANPPAESPPVADPVQGKTYLCHREPGVDGQLIVTDEAGSSPPANEYQIVAKQMDMVGRPNPLAQFLGGRTIAVGEKLELPKNVARQIFDLGDKIGEVTSFTLTLQKMQPENGKNCAVFLANVEAASTDASQMRLQVEGPLAVQVDTCRAARVNLAGPIGMSETRGSYSTAYQVIGTGRLQVNMASTYREAQR